MTNGPLVRSSRNFEPDLRGAVVSLSSLSSSFSSFSFLLQAASLELDVLKRPESAEMTKPTDQTSRQLFKDPLMRDPRGALHAVRRAHLGSNEKAFSARAGPDE